MKKVNRPTEIQSKLFTFFKEFDFISAGAARTHYGAAIEEVVCAALKLIPIAINGNYEVNFDAYKRDYFYEIKSVRAGGKVVLYDWRMGKEIPFKDKLFYVFGVHNVRGAKSNRELWENMQEYGIVLVIEEAQTIHTAAYMQKLMFIKNEKQSGYTRGGYNEGYRNLPVKPFMCSMTASINVKIYDFKIPVRVNATGVSLLEKAGQWE